MAARDARAADRVASMFARGVGIALMCTAVGFLAAVLAVSVMLADIEWSDAAGSKVGDLAAARKRIDDLGGSCPELAAVRDFRSMEADRAVKRGDAKGAREETLLQEHAEGRLAAVGC